MSNENKKMAAQLQHFKHLSPSTLEVRAKRGQSPHQSHDIATQKATIKQTTLNI
jgi:hypothetical protein